MVRHWFLVSATVLFPAVLSAQGNPDRSQSGNGARAVSMGGAFTAIADDATAIGWNPAGLALVRRPEFSFVGNMRFIQPDPRFDAANLDFSSVQVSHVSSPLTFASFVLPVSTGAVQLVTGLSYRALHDWTHAEELRTYYSNGTQSASLKERHTRDGGIYAIAPSVAVGFGNVLRVGATANFLTGETRFKSVVTRAGAITSPGTTTTTTTAGDYEGTANEVGLQLNLSERVRFGAKVALPYERLSTAKSGTTSSTTRLEIPQTVSAGFAFVVKEGSILAVDVRNEPWTKSRLLAATKDSVINAQPYDHDLTSFHLGFEQNVDYGGRRVSSRAGLFTKPTVYDDAEGKQIFGAGLAIGRGWRGRRFGTDLSLTYTRFDEHARVVSGSDRYATVDQEIQLTVALTWVLR
jgi:long-subunit fatty acid transport protein